MWAESEVELNELLSIKLLVAKEIYEIWVKGKRFLPLVSMHGFEIMNEGLNVINGYRLASFCGGSEIG